MSKPSMARTVYLHSIGNSFYQIFSQHGRPVSTPRRFDTEQHAIDWAENYVTSWPGTLLSLDQLRRSDAE